MNNYEVIINLTLAAGNEVALFKHKIVGWYQVGADMCVIVDGGILKVKETSEQIKNLMSNQAQGTNNKGEVIHG